MVQDYGFWYYKPISAYSEKESLSEKPYSEQDINAYVNLSMH